MTSAEFARKYNLLKCVSEHGARTYLAEQRGLARGRIVMVHYLDVGSAADARALLDRIGTLTTEAMDKVVETTEVDGVPVAVTLFLPQFESLPAWLGANAQSVPSVPLPPPSPEVDTDATLIIPAPDVRSPQPPRRAEPGEFTRIFGGVQSPTPREPASTPTPPRPRSSPVPATPPPVAPPPVSPAPRAEPGEFTRIFGKVESPPKLDAPAEPMLAPVEPLAPIPEPQKPPAPEKRSEGFTDLFQRLSSTPTSSASIPQPGAPMPPTSLPPAPSSGASPAMSSAAFSAPAASPPSPSLTPPSRPAEQSPVGGGGGRVPSEFTRMMARVSPSAPPAAATAPSGGGLGASGAAAAGAAAGKAAAAAGVQPPPAARRPPPLALVIGLIGAFLSAVALVLYFALRA